MSIAGSCFNQYFTIEITDGDSTETREAVQNALIERFSRFNTGDEVVISEMGAIISDVDGVVDYDLTLPASNIAITATHYAVMGAITWV